MSYASATRKAIAVVISNIQWILSMGLIIEDKFFFDWDGDSKAHESKTNKNNDLKQKA